MNEERYILAELVRRLKIEDKKHEETRGYNPSWNFKEICCLIEVIRSECVLGDEADGNPLDASLQFEGAE